MRVENSPLGRQGQFVDVYYNIMDEVDVDTIVKRMNRARWKLKDIIPLPEIVSLKLYLERGEGVNYRFMFEKIT